MRLQRIRHGRVHLQSQEISDKLKDFVRSISPFGCVNMDELRRRDDQTETRCCCDLPTTALNSQTWARFLLEGLCTNPSDTTIGAISCELSVLLQGIGAENLGLLSALYNQSGKQKCTEFCDAACKFALA